MQPLCPQCESEVNETHSAGIEILSWGDEQLQLPYYAIFALLVFPTHNVTPARQGTCRVHPFVSAAFSISGLPTRASMQVTPLCDITKG